MIKDKRRGSILVEVILTVVILSVGLTVIIQSMAAALRAMSSVEDYSSAIMLLDNKMFEYMSKDIKGTVRDQGELKHGEKVYVYSLETKPLSMPERRYVELNSEISWGKKKLGVTTYLLRPLDET